jgi:hypothetical protein
LALTCKVLYVFDISFYNYISHILCSLYIQHQAYDSFVCLKGHIRYHDTNSSLLVIISCPLYFIEYLQINILIQSFLIKCLFTCIFVLCQFDK